MSFGGRFLRREENDGRPKLSCTSSSKSSRHALTQMSLPKSIFQITLGSLNLNPRTFDNFIGKIISKVNKTHQGYVTARTGPHFVAFLYHRIQLRISTVICCSGKRKNAYVLVWYKFVLFSECFEDCDWLVKIPSVVCIKISGQIRPYFISLFAFQTNIISAVGSMTIKAVAIPLCIVKHICTFMSGRNNFNSTFYVQR